MITPKTAGAMVLAAVVVIGGLAVYENYQYSPSGQQQCLSLQAGEPVRSQVTNRTFGAVTEFALPGNDTWPSAITAAPDGSVWFVIQSVPGVVHLYPNNGTIVEYGWPGYKPSNASDCFPNVVSSGITLWNGRVWAEDEFGNALLGVRPSDGNVVSLNLTGRGNYPYWLAPGPDGNLWVTFDDSPARLAKVLPNLTMSIINLEGVGDDSPLQLEFLNSSVAILSTINLSENATTKGCVCNGHVYSFNPTQANSTIRPLVVGGGYNLIEPTSASYSEGTVWVAQHYASSVVEYDFGSGEWTKYPTSLVSWTNTTLPLMMVANGSSVWFNEHYANKIALIRPASGTMTEFSESDPPAVDSSGIQNDEYIAMSGGRLWFTSMSGNYVGFVDGRYVPTFSVSPLTTNRVVVPAGGSASVSLEVKGAWSGETKVGVSDSEGYFSIPSLISATPSASVVPPGTSPYVLDLNLVVSQSAPPGVYVVALTVTNREIQQSAFVYVTVK